MTVAALTCVLKVHIMAVESVFQPVRHDLQLHYLLADRNVRFGYVDLHFRVIDLIGQAVSDDLRQVPETVLKTDREITSTIYQNKAVSISGPVHVVWDMEGLPGSTHSVPALILRPYPSGHSVAACDPRKRDPVWPHVLQLGGYLCHLTVGEKAQTERQFCSFRSLGDGNKDAAPAWEILTSVPRLEALDPVLSATVTLSFWLTSFSMVLLGSPSLSVPHAWTS